MKTIEERLSDLEDKITVLMHKHDRDVPLPYSVHTRGMSPVPIMTCPICDYMIASGSSRPIPNYCQKCGQKIKGGEING